MGHGLNTEPEIESYDKTDPELAAALAKLPCPYCFQLPCWTNRGEFRILGCVNPECTVKPHATPEVRVHFLGKERGWEPANWDKRSLGSWEWIIGGRRSTPGTSVRPNQGYRG